MLDEKTAADLRWVLRALDVDPDNATQDREQRTRCPLHADCRESGDLNLSIDTQTGQYVCQAHRETGRISDLRRLMEAMLEEAAPVPRTPASAAVTIIDAPEPEFAPAPVIADRPLNRTAPKVLVLQQMLPSPEEIRAEAASRQAAARAALAERRLGTIERWILGLLASAFVLAGLTAAVLSGFANYQAFRASVGDPVQSVVWGWAGIIAAVISFGGFTFVYWHGARRRFGEAARAMLFAVIGAGTSIMGTEMYIRSNALAAEREVETAAANRDLLEAQIADWRRQLEGIPASTRSVEGLKAYIAEVERVGRTHEKPYRDAKNELGLAERRDDLIAKIEAANAELLGIGKGNILLRAEARTSLPSWLFALLIEVFSSQATSIGLVALLLLFGEPQRKTVS